MPGRRLSSSIDGITWKSGIGELKWYAIRSSSLRSDDCRSAPGAEVPCAFPGRDVPQTHERIVTTWADRYDPGDWLAFLLGEGYTHADHGRFEKRAR